MKVISQGIFCRMLEFCSLHLVVPPPSRLVSLINLSVSLVSPCDKAHLTFTRFKVDLLVEHRSLYATYGKVHGRFLDGQADK